jgi:iodotyrosine deiodinase
MPCNPEHRTVPAPQYRVSGEEALERTRAFRELMGTRRSFRQFSDRPVPFQLIRNAIATAATAPSGANQQPWRFVVLSDPGIKRRFRQAIETEEYEFYHSRASQEWLEALKPIGTDWRKPFMEVAPYLIVVFEVHKGPNSTRPYFAKESVGIAVGFLLASLHQAGLATLTHTTSPMGWVNELLGRPREERPFLVIPVGYPAEWATVPDIRRKPLEEVMVHLDGW